MALMNCAAYKGGLRPLVHRTAGEITHGFKARHT